MAASRHHVTLTSAKPATTPAGATPSPEARPTTEASTKLGAIQTTTPRTRKIETSISKVFTESAQERISKRLNGIRIAVVCGGAVAESEVSVATGRMIAEALNKANARVSVVGPDESLTRMLLKSTVDVVFPALHGPLGEDGCLQGLLEYHQVPYVGNGVLASACANDKIIAKRIFRGVGLPVARDVTLNRREPRQVATAKVRDLLGDNVVVKPARQGSAIGISFAQNAEQLDEALDIAFALDSDILVEECISGAEVTGAVLDLEQPEALPLIEIRTPEGSWYDYQHRYTTGLAEHIVPAPLEERIYQEVQKFAIAAHRALTCRQLSRSDFLVTGGGQVVLLEVNTMPGMTPTSLYPDAASRVGYTFDSLISALVCDALDKYKGSD